MYMNDQKEELCDLLLEWTKPTFRKDPPLCSTLVIRPGINSAGSYFFPKSVLSDVYAHDLIISGH